MKYLNKCAPPLNIDLTPFYLATPPPPKKSARPPIMSKPAQNFAELDSPSWNVPLPKNTKTHFLKKQNILFATMKWEHIWTLKYEYTVAKSKNQRRLRRLLSILFLLAGLVTDVTGIFNADSRKIDSKLSGLRWFFLWRFTQRRGIFTSK